MAMILCVYGAMWLWCYVAMILGGYGTRWLWYYVAMILCGYDTMWLLLTRQPCYYKAMLDIIRITHVHN